MPSKFVEQNVSYKSLNSIAVMNKVEIGYCAGQIWTLLSSNNGKCSYDELKKKSNMPGTQFDAALGWLSREDKIEFEETCKGLFVFLPMNYYF